ncbi:MAG: FeoA family protein [Pseudomonadota bacterium]
MTQSLWDLERGQTGIIQRFDDGLPESYRNRLTELGFYPGERVACLQAPALGAPRVYRVSNSTFADCDSSRAARRRNAE